jgi:hypothetical protein
MSRFANRKLTSPKRQREGSPGAALINAALSLALRAGKALRPGDAQRREGDRKQRNIKARASGWNDQKPGTSLHWYILRKSVDFFS